MPATDQRGLIRIVNGSLEIGAVEVQEGEELSDPPVDNSARIRSLKRTISKEQRKLRKAKKKKQRSKVRSISRKIRKLNRQLRSL